MMTGASAVALVAAAAVAYRVATTIPVPGGPTASVPHTSAGPEPASPVTKPAQQQMATAAPTATAPATSLSTAPPQAAPRAAPQAAPASAAPSFDVVRVEPDGSTVVAGRGASGARVRLLDRGQVVGEAVADAGGQFVILPKTLAPGDHELTLESKSSAGSPENSVQSVTVAVRSDHAPALVALASPDQPTRILAGAGPTAPVPAAAAEGGAPVYIRTAEAGGDGKFFASGTAAPGAHVRLYLNDSEIAGVTADQSGKWSLTVAKGLTPGAYKVRADAVNGGGKVVARAEVPFDFTTARPEPGAQVASSDTPASSSAAVVDELRTVKVVRGDSLWRISRNILGQGRRYTQIYEANAKQIRDQSLIYPGQVFVVPKG